MYLELKKAKDKGFGSTREKKEKPSRLFYDKLSFHCETLIYLEKYIKYLPFK